MDRPRTCDQCGNYAVLHYAEGYCSVRCEVVVPLALLSRRCTEWRARDAASEALAGPRSELC